jgi:3'-phosphoadenosine 5'-phosphosulfate sulfotransferase (PAPS reductase)/FAD synthetase
LNGPDNLADYDIILINTSGGKDSQTMMRLVVAECKRQNVNLSKVVAVHADLGRVEWAGTKTLAELQARTYGLRFETVSRNQGDLLDHIEKHGKFPGRVPGGRNIRYCTSDHKRGPVMRVMTALVRELNLDRPVKILNCLGNRAQESRERAAQKPFSWNKLASNKTKRHVWDWLPIHQWQLEEVWTDIWASKVPYHYAYDLGMPRLSCCFCVYASEDALVLSAQHNPELADEYVAVEIKIGHRFTDKLSMAEIVEKAQSASVTSVADWAA